MDRGLQEVSRIAPTIERHNKRQGRRSRSGRSADVSSRASQGSICRPMESPLSHTQHGKHTQHTPGQEFTIPLPK